MWSAMEVAAGALELCKILRTHSRSLRELVCAIDEEVGIQAQLIEFVASHQAWPTSQGDRLAAMFGSSSDFFWT